MSVSAGRVTLSFDGAIETLALRELAGQSDVELELPCFLVEFAESRLFVEVIDSKVSIKTLKDMRSDLLAPSLARKFRDGIFFCSFMNRELKRVDYAVLLLLPEVDGILLSALEDELKKRMPISHPSWSEASAVSCSVMNQEQWVKRFGAGALEVKTEKVRKSPKRKTI